MLSDNLNTDFKDILQTALERLGNLVVKTEQEQPKKVINYEEVIIKIANDIIPNFKLDKENKEIFDKMFSYFSDGTELDLNKGIMIIGNSGTGKTKLFQIFQKFSQLYKKPKSFKIISSRIIQESFLQQGVKGINQYSYNLQTNEFNVQTTNPTNYMIDDLGNENSYVTHFGTNYKPVEEVLLNRYDLYSNDGIITHVSTNFTPDILKTMYDQRTISRFKEMFNFLVLSGKDRRK